MALIFHGSRNKFTCFDPTFKLSAEGDGDFDGFYFVDNPYGAKWHCESVLKCTGDEGYIFVCEIPDRFLKRNIERSEGYYRGEIFGVTHKRLDLVTILEIIPLKDAESFLYSYNHIQINR